MTFFRALASHFKLEISELALVSIATKNMGEKLVPAKSVSEALPRRDNKL